MQVIKTDLPFIELINGVIFTKLDEEKSISDVISKIQADNFLLLPNFVLFEDDEKEKDEVKEKSVLFNDLDQSLVGGDGGKSENRESLEEKRKRLLDGVSGQGEGSEGKDEEHSSTDDQAKEKADNVQTESVDEKAQKLAKKVKGKK